MTTPTSDNLIDTIIQKIPNIIDKKKEIFLSDYIHKYDDINILICICCIINCKLIDKQYDKNIDIDRYLIFIKSYINETYDFLHDDSGDTDQSILIKIYNSFALINNDKIDKTTNAGAAAINDVLIKIKENSIQNHEIFEYLGMFDDSNDKYYPFLSNYYYLNDNKDFKININDNNFINYLIRIISKLIVKNITDADDDIHIDIVNKQLTYKLSRIDNYIIKLNYLYNFLFYDEYYSKYNIHKLFNNIKYITPEDARKISDKILFITIEYREKNDIQCPYFYLDQDDKNFIIIDNENDINYKKAFEMIKEMDKFKIILLKNYDIVKINDIVNKLYKNDIYKIPDICNVNNKRDEEIAKDELFFKSISDNAFNTIVHEKIKKVEKMKEKARDVYDEIPNKTTSNSTALKSFMDEVEFINVLTQKLTMPNYITFNSDEFRVIDEKLIEINEIISHENKLSKVVESVREEGAEEEEE
jgi:hypothetical protein